MLRPGSFLVHALFGGLVALQSRTLQFPVQVVLCVGLLCGWDLRIVHELDLACARRAGDPERADVRPQDMTWTIRCDDAYTVTAARVGGSASFGYLVRESDKCAPCSSPLLLALHASQSTLFCPA